MRKIERDEVLKRIGRDLAEHRKKAGYTAEQAAGLLGLSVRTVRAYEYGERQMTVKAASDMAEAYGVPVTALLGIHGCLSDVRRDIRPAGYRYIRRSMEMSQTEFAAEIGVSRGSIVNYETGKVSMPVKIFIRLCEICALSDSEINELAAEAPPDREGK